MPGKNDVLVATETFSVDVDGGTIIVHKGETKVRANHPLARANPHLFSPDEPRPDVKQAKAKKKK